MKWTNKNDEHGQICASEAETDGVFASVEWHERIWMKEDNEQWEWTVSTHDMMRSKFGRAASMESAQKACEEAAKCLG